MTGFGIILYVGVNEDEGSGITITCGAELDACPELDRLITEGPGFGGKGNAVWDVLLKKVPPIRLELPCIMRLE